jgi:hypothetical protein
LHQVTITATDSSVSLPLSGQATLTQTRGPAASVSVAFSAASIVANGSSAATATATVKDATGNPVPGNSVGFSSSDAGEQISAVSDHGDGTYSVTIRSSTTAHQVTITATDSSASPPVSGNARLTQTGSNSQAAAPQAFALSIAPHTFVLTGRLVKSRCVGKSRANRRHHSCTRQTALRVSFRLTVAASVSFTIQRVVPGRVVNGRCVKPTRKNRGHRRCTRVVGVPGTLVRSGTAGANSFVFDGKIGGHRLGPGSYQMTIIPAANRRAGSAQRTTFKLLR